MTALDERPAAATALHSAHPDSPGRRAETARLGRCLPGWQGESLSFYRLPTCTPACVQEQQSKACWIHSAKCDERCRDAAEYQRWCGFAASPSGPVRRVTGAEQQAIEAAEWRLSSPPVPHDGGVDLELEYRKWMTQRGLA